jgi:hypothetical protein
MSTSSLQLHIRRRLWFLVSLAIVVVIALLVQPAVSRTTTHKEDRDAQVIKVAASCATKCRDLCTALPESEDPDCDHRCDSISAAFNGSVKDPAALDPKTAFSAVQEMQMCFTGCSLRCNIPDGGDAKASISCKDKCADTFRLFGPAIVVLGKTMAANGLAAPATPPHAPAPGKDDFKLEACSDACNRKCAATAVASQGKTSEACGGSCAEACGLYSGVTTVLQAAMPPAAVPSPAALGDDTIANTFKACSEHCAANDIKCSTKCRYACYILTKAKASMKLATGGFGLPS